MIDASAERSDGEIAGIAIVSTLPVQTLQAKRPDEHYC
jgi:hypothetical protein